MRVVQAFTREERQRARSSARSTTATATANHETVVLNGLYFPFVDFLSSAATAVVLGFGGWLVFEGAVTVGTLFAFIALPRELLRPDPAALAALQHVPRGRRRARQDHGRDGRGAGGRRPAGAAPLPHDRGPRPLRAASASATADGPEVLHGIDLDVPAGTTVALVGHTGAGKSTIAKLLARFYDPREGAITIDGHDLRDVTQESLRRQLGIVPQEGFLFAGTVRDNIAFGRPEASRRGDRRGRRGRRRATSSSSGSRTATRPRSASAAAASRSASASSSRSRARSSPTRASSSSTRRRRASTSAPSGGSSTRSAACSPAAPRSSSPTASRRSATPT